MMHFRRAVEREDRLKDCGLEDSSAKTLGSRSLQESLGLYRFFLFRR